jgi:hypothetical protein
MSSVTASACPARQRVASFDQIDAERRRTLRPSMSASSDIDLIRPGTKPGTEASTFDDSIDHQAAVSSALASVFRGKFCDFILPNRTSTRFNKHDVI